MAVGTRGGLPGDSQVVGMLRATSGTRASLFLSLCHARHGPPPGHLLLFLLLLLFFLILMLHCFYPCAMPGMALHLDICCADAQQRDGSAEMTAWRTLASVLTAAATAASEAHCRAATERAANAGCVGEEARPARMMSPAGSVGLCLSDDSHSGGPSPGGGSAGRAADSWRDIRGLIESRQWWWPAYHFANEQGVRGVFPMKAGLG
jgi:hypothetical protein